MFNTNKINKTINLIVAVIATVVVICNAVSLTVLARPVYYLDIELLDIAETSGISKEACKLNYDKLIDYNLLGGDEELIFPTLRMSEQGRIHFEEVKDIFIAMQKIAIVGLLALAIWIFYIKKKGASIRNSLWLKYCLSVALTIAAICAGAMIIDWQWAFTTMHEIFFDNDYWIFNAYTDPVIKILPEKFFFHCGILIVILTILQVTAMRIVYRRIIK